MTTIPNLNVVVQQGSTARDAQQIRPNADEASQIAGTPQPGKENEQLTTVQTTNESDRLHEDKEKAAEREAKKKKKKKEKKDDALKAAEHDPDEPGGLLDIEV